MKLRFFPLMEEGDGGGSGAKPVVKEPETFSREYVTELRAENRGWRLKHQESEQQKAEALKKVEDADKAADAKVKEANTAAEQRIIRAELKAAAVKAGMIDLDGLKLADLSKVKLGDDGEVVGADELMASLKKSKPYLFGTTSTSSTHDAPKPGDQKPKKISEMTDAERRADAKARGISGPM
jgi:Phage minor structural protein GP20